MKFNIKEKKYPHCNPDFQITWNMYIIPITSTETVIKFLVYVLNVKLCSATQPLRQLINRANASENLPTAFSLSDCNRTK